MDFPRTLVIGIDGATFRLIKPWAEAGLLPTIAHLMKHGSHAILDAYPYTNSAAAWTNLVTGYNPGKHSIFNFTVRGQGKTHTHPASARDRHKPAFWHTLAASGLRIGVMNVPITFPAENVNGFMVSGMDTPDPNDKRFTAPEGLFHELRRAGIEYVIDVPDIGKAARQGYDTVPPSVRDMTLARTRSFLSLVEKYPCDAAMLVYVGSDRMSHYFWRETAPEPNAPEWKPLRDLFMLYDTELQKILRHADSQTTVFLLSDHGFGPVQAATYGVNTLLQRLGYQAHYTRPARSTVLGSLLQLGRRTVPPKWQSRLAARFGRIHSHAARSDKYGPVNWAQTRAYGNKSGAIYINSLRSSPEGIVDERDFEPLWQELASVMLALTDADTELPLVDKVHRPTEYYHGPFVDGGPDMLARWNRQNLGNGLRYRQNGQEIVVHPVRPKQEWVGTHNPDGIFIAYGKGIRPGIAHPPVTHFELAPTLLYLHDHPIAEDMDGRVLTDWFEPEMVLNRVPRSQSAADYAPVGAALNDAENELIEKRLRSLGYLE